MSATVDTAFQPAYTRAASFWLVIPLSMLEDTTMPRRPIGLLVTLAFGLLWMPLTASPESMGRVPRIGVLSAVTPSGDAAQWFSQALGELGCGVSANRLYGFEQFNL
jgi:hypothetical protein